LLLGLVLVAASVAVGSATFSAAARTVPVYVAAEPLVPGEPVDADVLVTREVRLAESLDRYLVADTEVPEGLVAVRTVGRGELVPISAVATSASLDLRPVAVTPRGTPPRGVVEGSTVDLWFVPDADAGGDAGTGAGGEPHELATGLTVSEVSEPAGGFSVGSGVTVHVLVPRADLAAVLAALSGAGAVELVHVPGAA